MRCKNCGHDKESHGESGLCYANGYPLDQCDPSAGYAACRCAGWKGGNPE